MRDDIEDRALAIGDRRSSELLYRACRMGVRGTAFPWYRTSVEGREHLSASGSLIIAPVHRSLLDIPLVGAASDRRPRYLAKDELFSKPAVGWFLAALGGFPVRRGKGDRAALHAALRLLEQGEVLVVFPEGTRQTGPKVAELFEGTAYLAAKTVARVTPVGIAGTEGLMPKRANLARRGRVAIVAGPPLDPPSTARSDRHAFTVRLHHELQCLFDRANELVAARTSV